MCSSALQKLKQILLIKGKFWQRECFSPATRKSPSWQHLLCALLSIVFKAGFLGNNPVDLNRDEVNRVWAWLLQKLLNLNTESLPISFCFCSFFQRRKKPLRDIIMIIFYRMTERTLWKEPRFPLYAIDAGSWFSSKHQGCTYVFKTQVHWLHTHTLCLP